MKKLLVFLQNPDGKVGIFRENKARNWDFCRKTRDFEIILNWVLGVEPLNLICHSEEVEGKSEQRERERSRAFQW